MPTNLEITPSPYCVGALMMERLAEAVHRAYCDNVKQRTGKDYWTCGDYSLLDEEIKQIDRDTVSAVVRELFS